MYDIDPAELHRVYPPQGSLVDNPVHLATHEQTEIERLKATVEGLERLCRQIEGERDSLREQNTRLTALLTDQRAKAAPDAIVTPPPTSNVIPTPPAAPPAPVAAAPVENQLPAEQAPAKRKGWLGWRAR